MNATFASNSTEWSPANITGMVNIVLTSLYVLINLHQSYNHKHYKSSCCDKTCFDIIIDWEEDTEQKK
jgi:hypothetical protein